MRVRVRVRVRARGRGRARVRVRNPNPNPNTNPNHPNQTSACGLQPLQPSNPGYAPPPLDQVALALT